MIERINSRIFGVVAKATHEQRAAIESYVAENPVDVFQALNKALNQRGLMIGVRMLNQDAAPGSMSDRQDITSDPRIRDSGPVGPDRPQQSEEK